MSRKKIILISLLAITVIVSSFVAFHFFSNDSSSKVDTSKQLKTNLKEKEKKDKTDNKETEKEETNPEITTPQTNETENQNIEETPKEKTNDNKVQTPQQAPNNNQQTTTQTTPKQPTTPPKVVETPSCTPKLFYVVFRADFDSLDKLKATAEQYKEIYGFVGYEYMDATDDCGDTYYQLTMKTKDDKLVEYSDIPKP